MAPVLVFTLWRSGGAIGPLESIVLGVIVMVASALMHAGMFALGCAWSGMPHLPRVRWAFGAGMLITIGLYPSLALTSPDAPSTNLATLDESGYAVPPGSNAPRRHCLRPARAGMPKNNPRRMICIKLA